MEGKKLSDVFTEAYNDNLWGDPDSRSGSGSNMEQTRIIRVRIPGLIEQYGIKTIVDAPCGDLFWMKTLFPKFQSEGIAYTGLDIVPTIVQQNKLNFPGPGFNFISVDLTKGPIPRADLVFTRDCLLHLSYKNILAILTNYKASGSKYLLVSTYAGPQRKNADVEGFSIGGRALNLEKAPFYFKPPLEMITEGCTEGNNEYTDKSLALWKLKDINLARIRISIALAPYKDSISAFFEKGRVKFTRIKNGFKRRLKKILFNN